MNNATQPFNLNVQGFFQASTVAPQARMSQIVGNGPTHFGEQVVVNGGVVAINPFVGADGPAAGPAWDTWTLPTPLPIAGDAASVNVAVNRREHTSTDCLSWGAVVVSTTVQDTDSDGLLDVWETTSGLTDPDGTPLPDLAAMGADKNVQDLFVELGYMASATGYNTPARTGDRAFPHALGHRAQLCVYAVPQRGSAAGHCVSERILPHQRALGCGQELSRRDSEREPVQEQLDPGLRDRPARSGARRRPD